jgi:hypothetical protein
MAAMKAMSFSRAGPTVKPTLQSTTVSFADGDTYDVPYVVMTSSVSR